MLCKNKPQFTIVSFVIKVDYNDNHNRRDVRVLPSKVIRPEIQIFFKDNQLKKEPTQQLTTVDGFILGRSNHKKNVNKNV